MQSTIAFTYSTSMIYDLFLLQIKFAKLKNIKFLKCIVNFFSIL